MFSAQTHTKISYLVLLALLGLGLLLRVART